MTTYKDVVQDLELEFSKLGWNINEQMEYLEKVAKYLVKFKPGMRATIANVTKENTRPAFIAAAKLYIADYDPELTFTDDYKQIYKS